jgi:uncharacterized protein Yka (UPF0111/DUF47 family)
MGKLSALFSGNEKQLFAYFREFGELIEQAGTEFMMLVEDFANAKTHAETLREIEHNDFYDNNKNTIEEFLDNNTFLPFDHDDIEKLIGHGDDVIDLLWGAADRIANVYDELTDPDPELLEMSKIISSMTQTTKQLFVVLKNIKHEKKLSEIVTRFHNEENHADELRNIIAKRRYQATRKNPYLESLRNAWGDIIQHLEHATDVCVDITDVLKTFNKKYR